MAFDNLLPGKNMSGSAQPDKVYATLSVAKTGSKVILVTFGQHIIAGLKWTPGETYLLIQEGYDADSRVLLISSVEKNYPGTVHKLSPNGHSNNAATVSVTCSKFKHHTTPDASLRQQEVGIQTFKNSIKLLMPDWFDPIPTNEPGK